MHDISQPVAHAMRHALRMVSDAYRHKATLSQGDMKIVWGILDVCAVEENSLSLNASQRRLLTYLNEQAGCPVLMAAE